jgi:hypothetical protein
VRVTSRKRALTATLREEPLSNATSSSESDPCSTPGFLHLHELCGLEHNFHWNLRMTATTDSPAAPQSQFYRQPEGELNVGRFLGDTNPESEVERTSLVEPIRDAK